jgi:APA family basic amino acid/polyamine antiporter
MTEPANSSASPNASLDPSAADAQPKRHLSALYIAMLAVAMVVGAGIFKSPALVAAGSGEVEWMFAAWIIAGVISLIGALTYAELATSFPNAGGDYHFLKLAYGRPVGFLFAWARFAIINTGSIALLGYVLGGYLNSAFPIAEGLTGSAIYAVIAVVIMTAFNLRGGGRGADAADYGMTGMEVAGLLIMTAAGVWLVLTGVPSADSVAHSTGITPDSNAGFPDWSAYGQALVMALLAFGGWTEVATLSAEARDARRGMVRALVMAIGLITALYLMVNWAFWFGLGMTGLAASSAPASDLMALAFGPAAGVITAIAIAFAVITSINATIVVGARTTYACARDWPAIDALGRWDNRRGVPTAAIWAQGTVGIALVVFAAFYDGFSTMVDFTAPVYWLFIMLSGIAVFILRIKHPNLDRPFRVPLFPVLPAIFILAAGLMLWSGVNFVSSNLAVGAGVSAGVLISGVIVMIVLSLAQGRKPTPREAG